MKRRTALSLRRLCTLVATSCACNGGLSLLGDANSSDDASPDAHADAVSPDDASAETDADAVLPDVPPSTTCADLDADLVVPRDFPTIQAAIDAAPAGALVCVEPGTYYGWLMMHDRPPLRLVGAAGPAATIIDGNAEWSVVSFTLMAEGTALEGFTLRNGWQDSPRGAGIDMYGSSVSLRNILVVDNASDWSPIGGVHIHGGSSAVLSDVVVARNVGRGGHAGGILVSNSAVTARNVVVTGNAAARAAMSGGGGIYLASGGPGEESSLSLNGAIVAGNTGGIGVGENAVLTARNAVVTGNLGPGLFVDGGSADLANVAFTFNDGTGLHVRRGTVSARWCNAFGNTSTDVAGFDGSWEAGGNLSIDPLYLDVSDERPLQWDLHLSTTSPLIDAGDPAILDPDGSRSDIGAWTGPGALDWDLDGDAYPSWWQPGPYDSLAYPSLGLDCNDSDRTLHPGAGC